MIFWWFNLTFELDNGRLVVKDDKNLEIWQSWPTQNNNLGITFNRPVQYRYVPCDGKPYRNKQILLINTQFNASQSLISQDTLWDFAFTKQKLVVRHLVSSFQMLLKGHFLLLMEL